MINIFESDTVGMSSGFFDSAGYVTLILSIIPLVIFICLAIRSKNVRAFQFQISLFIAIYILGEIIETNRIAVFSILPPDIGPQIHVGSAVFFTIMVWFRFYCAEKSGKKMIESDTDNGDDSDSRLEQH
jgi:hypothetical protein